MSCLRAGGAFAHQWARHCWSWLRAQAWVLAWRGLSSARAHLSWEEPASTARRACRRVVVARAWQGGHTAWPKEVRLAGLTRGSHGLQPDTHRLRDGEPLATDGWQSRLGRLLGLGRRGRGRCRCWLCGCVIRLSGLDRALLGFRVLRLCLVRSCGGEVLNNLLQLSDVLLGEHSGRGCGAWWVVLSCLGVLRCVLRVLVVFLVTWCVLLRCAVGQTRMVGRKEFNRLNRLSITHTLRGPYRRAANLAAAQKCCA